MEMARKPISFTFDPIDMLLSLQIDFSFVRAEMVCAVLERISGFEPVSETTAPRYLKLVTVPSFCPYTLISLWMLLALFVIRLVFTAQISILYFVQVLSRVSSVVSSSCSSCIYVISKLQIINISAACANLSIMTFQSIRHDLFKKNDEEGG